MGRRSWISVCLICGLVANLTACGGRTSSDQAKTQAKAACGTLEALGAGLRGASQSAPLSGTAVDQRLGAAQADVHNAATLDAKAWRGFQSDVDTFVSTLRAGKNPDGGLVGRISGTCDTINPQGSHAG